MTETKFKVGDEVKIAIPLPGQTAHSWDAEMPGGGSWMRDHWADQRVYKITRISGDQMIYLNTQSFGARIDYWYKPAHLCSATAPTLQVREVIEEKIVVKELPNDTEFEMIETPQETQISTGTAVGMAALATFGIAVASKVKDHFFNKQEQKSQVKQEIKR